jgi:hypothetical protein
MAPKPEPQEDNEIRWRWFNEADAETRQANPKYYWAMREEGSPAQYFWDEMEVSKEEYLQYSNKEDCEL